jgi:hypothetical protein
MAKKKVYKDYAFVALEAPRGIATTATALEKVRLRPGFQLPKSYCRYATELGDGRLGKLLKIYIPRKGEFSLTKRSHVLTDMIRESVEADLFEYEPAGSPELALRLIPFGTSENGHVFAWDPQRETSPGEYAIYAIGSKCLAIREGGANLFEFVSMCFDERVRKILGSGYTPLPAVFQPFTK